MKKLFTLLSLFLVMLQVAIAGEVGSLPLTIVIEIEANSIAGSVSVTGANSQTTSGNFTYAVCKIEAEVSLVATTNTGYNFQEWSGNDIAHLYNLLPTDQCNPYTFTLFADAGFIELAAGTNYLDTIKVNSSFRNKLICSNGKVYGNYQYGFFRSSNLAINNFGYFVTQVDSLGSTLVLDSSITPPSIMYNQVKKDDVRIVDWPWNDVTFNFLQEIDSLRFSIQILAIQITYKSDHLWKMMLPWNDFLINNGTSHRVKLPVSATDFTTYTAYIDQFEYPEWASVNITNNIPLNLDSVSRITFELDENAEKASYEGVFRIDSIKICSRYSLCCYDSMPDYSHTGIEDLLFKSFNIYPNPASTSLTIMTSPPFNHHSSEIQITNTLGQFVFSQHFDKLNATQLNKSTSQQFTIDVSQFSEGLYFIRVGDSVQKFVKE